MPRTSLRIPATTANLGPGFDTFGLALTLYNRIRVETTGSDGGISVSVRGEGEGQIPTDERNLIFVAIRAFFERIGRPIPGLKIDAENKIPLARGLGSSASAVVGGLVAANLLSGSPLSNADLIHLATQIEGHPDNAVACVLGGFTAAAQSDGKVTTIRTSLEKRIRAVVAIPTFELETLKARSALPASVSMQDAVYNVSHTALMAIALAKGDFEVVRAAMKDRLHQPYRASFIPGMTRVFEGAMGAGALGAAISGAGPALIALVEEQEARVGEAMCRAWEAEGISSRILTLDVDTDGTVET